MANVESGRLSRKAPGREEKPAKRSEQSARPPEAILEEIQKTGWTPELEAELLDTPMLLQIQPQLMNNLVKEAGQQRDANLWRLLAKICERRNEDQTAVTYVTEALQIQPDDVASMGLLARLCEKRHADAEAADWHRRVLEIDPTQVASNRSLAHFHYQRGEYETALAVSCSTRRVRTENAYQQIVLVAGHGQKRRHARSGAATYRRTTLA